MDSDPRTRSRREGEAPGAYEPAVQPRGLVVLVHAGELAPPWGRAVCDVLHRYRLSTLLCPPLGDDVPVQQVLRAVDWARAIEPAAPGWTGLVGAGAGGAAVLQGVVERPAAVRAVVTCGARLAPLAPLLPRVQAATLLIAAGDDVEVLPAHRRALRALACEKRLEILPGAGRCFDDADSTATVAHLSGQWFTNHLVPGRPLA